MIVDCFESAPGEYSMLIQAENNKDDIIIDSCSKMASWNSFNAQIGQWTNADDPKQGWHREVLIPNITQANFTVLEDFFIPNVPESYQQFLEKIKLNNIQSNTNKPGDGKQEELSTASNFKLEENIATTLSFK